MRGNFNSSDMSSPRNDAPPAPYWSPRPAAISLPLHVPPSSGPSTPALILPTPTLLRQQPDADCCPIGAFPKPNRNLFFLLRCWLFDYSCLNSIKLQLKSSLLVTFYILLITLSFKLLTARGSILWRGVHVNMSRRNVSNYWWKWKRARVNEFDSRGSTRDEVLFLIDFPSLFMLQSNFVLRRLKRKKKKERRYKHRSTLEDKEL